ncbi:MAG: hypothetical protein Kapaf2KO_02970 [Candidatus Kapaibacteriales bacterium]
MDLGQFSISLAVKDLQKSREFYEKFGFRQLAGNPEHNYLIMKNGKSIIGLFQGMFEDNILTFNPGWDENGQNTESFDDVRDLKSKLEQAGVELQQVNTPGDAGPGSFVAIDPDGNPVLVDQHR